MSLILSGIMSPTVGPNQLQFTAPDPSGVGFGSITIYNPSQSAINLYLTQLGNLAALPDYVISGGSVMTIPIPGVTNLTCAFATYPSGGGTANITITDAVLTATSNGLPQAAGSPGVPPAAKSNGFLNQVGVMYSATAAFINLPSNNGSLSQIIPTTSLIGTLRTYIYSYQIVGTISAPAEIVAYLFFENGIGTEICTFMQYVATKVDGIIYDFTAVDLQQSGGDLPLFSLDAGQPLTLVFTSSGGLLNDCEASVGINVSYAQF